METKQRHIDHFQVSRAYMALAFLDIDTVSKAQF
jgi:hypothetical protein